MDFVLIVDLLKTESNFQYKWPNYSMSFDSQMNVEQHEREIELNIFSIVEIKERKERKCQ